MTGAIAYLTSQYPATSHTFILREVAALRSAGVVVDTFSVRPAADDELDDPAIAAEAATTFVILAQNGLVFATAHLVQMAVAPARYVAGLVHAIRHRPPGLRGLGLSLAHFVESAVLARELRRRKIRHLHNHFANSAATVGLLAARMADVPWSFTIHGISEFDYPAGITLPDKVRASRFVACASWFGRAQAMRVVDPGHWPKIGVVRCGIPLAQFSEATGGREGRTLICVGRLSPEKGHAGLFGAFAAVLQRISDTRLILVGSGPNEDDLRRRATELGIDRAVTFAGRRAGHETLALITRADVLVMASLMEGLPIVLLEAMALGTAVIAPRLAGIPELIEHDRNGLLFTPSDWSELARGIERLLTDDALRARLADQARRTIVDRFNIERSTTLLKQMLSEPDLSSTGGELK